ncbi:MAG: hypothetical protein LLG20_05550, partial [Acidobacteriales bacterium]|nr:hypothetical protein [Terriglobales bacterium]
MVTREQVVHAYRLILGREPESEEVIQNHMDTHEDVDSLRTVMLQSDEFRQAALMSPWLLPMDQCPRIEVETAVAGEKQPSALF